jgi:hypothetical protein
MKFRRTCDKTFKVVFILLCFGLFFFNSLDNAKDYYSGETMVTSNNLMEKELSLPSFTFCNTSGFKSLNQYYTLMQYLENTMNASDIFMEPPSPPLKSIYSKHLGHCFTYTVC